eukprot:TRINITY_DN76_c1_g1_i1.p1 TRINITY_DN76_c1_g1~~TRINITY_DN76_c1_g1_i1.p1  ORF type:complete len:462 (+),score=80.89 TRINITY_DN76_c1_g1_i1:64-1449(+)
MGCKLSLDKVPKMVPVEETRYLIRKKESTDKQFTVVLDLDGTIGMWWKKEVRNGSTERSYMMFAQRPGLLQFLEDLGKLAEIVLWASCPMEQARYAFAAADPNRVISHIIYRDSRWYNPSVKDGTKKRLHLLGRSLEHVIAIDDSPDDITDFLNTIVIKKWDKRDEDDETLKQVLEIIKENITAKVKVPEFMIGCKDLKTITRMPHKFKTLVAPQAADTTNTDTVNSFQRILVKGKNEPMGFILRKDKVTHRLYIKSVRAGTPASRCGFGPFVDCRILAVEGVPDPQLSDLMAEAEGKETVVFHLKINIHEAPKGVATDANLREIVEAKRDTLGLEFKDIKGKVYIWGMTRDSPLRNKPHIVGCVVVYVDGQKFASSAELSQYFKAKRGPVTTVLEVSNRALGGSSLDESSFTQNTDPLSSSLTTTIASSSAFHDDFLDADNSAPITHLYQISRMPEAEHR